MRITVCGAGPAGLGMAAFLMSQGHQVVLYDMPAFADRLTALRQDPTLTCRELVEYTGRLSGVTDQVEEALRGADAVVIATHAAAHRQLAALFAGKIAPSQTVLLCPGYVGGGVEFMAALREASSGELPSYFEASSYPLLSRKEGDHLVQLAGCKRGFYVFVPPHLDEDPFVKNFLSIFAPVKVTRHPLEPGLNEINIIVHAVVTLLNASRVDHAQPWRFYRDGLTPSVMEVVEEIDRERTRLEEALGLTPHPLTQMLQEFYGDQGMKGNSLYEQLSTFQPFEKVPGPVSFQSRFVTEDVCYGLVPMAHLGQEKGVPMPCTELILSLAQQMTHVDYRKTGRQVSAE